MIVIVIVGDGVVVAINLGILRRKTLVGRDCSGRLLGLLHGGCLLHRTDRDAKDLNENPRDARKVAYLEEGWSSSSSSSSASVLAFLDDLVGALLVWAILDFLATDVFFLETAFEVEELQL